MADSLPYTRSKPNPPDWDEKDIPTKRWIIQLWKFIRTYVQDPSNVFITGGSVSVTDLNTGGLTATTVSASTSTTTKALKLSGAVTVPVTNGGSFDAGSTSYYVYYLDTTNSTIATFSLDMHLTTPSSGEVVLGILVVDTGGSITNLTLTRDGVAVGALDTAKFATNGYFAFLMDSSNFILPISK